MKFLIFAGGNGTRLWPVSRKNHPKQFQKFIKGKSLFQMTVERLLKKFSKEDLYVVSPKEYVPIIKEEFSGISDSNILIEAETRDTLACVGFGAYVLNKKFPDENIAILWSDHLIKYEDVFLKAYITADKYATEHDKIVQIDVNPTSPNVNLGYVKIGEQIETLDNFGIYKFVKHIEKPDLQAAKTFIESFEYLWHTGYKVFPKGKLPELYKKYMPHVAEILEKITEKYFKGEDFASLYSAIDKISIDYAILEKVGPDEVVDIPADLGWSDIGNWASFKEVMEETTESNVVISDSITLDTKNTLLLSSSKDKIICTVGVSNMAIVDTDDALLVCSLDVAHKLKDVIAELKSKKKDSLL